MRCPLCNQHLSCGGNLWLRPRDDECPSCRVPLAHYRSSTTLIVVALIVAFASAVVLVVTGIVRPSQPWVSGEPSAKWLKLLMLLLTLPIYWALIWPLWLFGHYRLVLARCPYCRTEFRIPEGEPWFRIPGEMLGNPGAATKEVHCPHCHLPFRVDQKAGGGRPI
jgi:hypothetical protein